VLKDRHGLVAERVHDQMSDVMNGLQAGVSQMSWSGPSRERGFEKSQSQLFEGVRTERGCGTGRNPFCLSNKSVFASTTGLIRHAFILNYLLIKLSSCYTL